MHRNIIFIHHARDGLIDAEAVTGEISAAKPRVAVRVTQLP